MMNNAQLQTADQTLKGGVIALVGYVLNKVGAEPEFVALVIPVIAGLMATLSTHFGNKDTACMFVSKPKVDE